MSDSTQWADRLWGLIERRPADLFWAFVLAQLVLWTLAPALVFTNLPLDVIELSAWGREWQLGYHKHPPLPSWILEGLAFLSGRAAWPAYFASQMSIVVAYWAIWQLGRDVLGEGREGEGERGALLAVLLTSLIYYYNFPTPEFNHNVLQIPFWALLGLYGYRVLARERLADWLMLGLVTGGALYVKYSLAIMVLTLLGFLLWHPKARAKLASRGFWLAIATAFLVAAPHLFWLVESGFQSLLYADARMKPLEGIIGHILGPLAFPGAQILDHAGLILVLVLGGGLFATGRDRQPVSFSARSDFARAYVLWIALVPVLATTLLSFLMGVEFRSMWGAPMFSFSALALMLVMQPLFDRQRFAVMASTWLVLHIGVLLALAGMGLFGAHFNKKVPRTAFPGEQAGQVFNRLWREKMRTRLHFVDGDQWIGGNISWYAPDRPALISSAKPELTPWADERQIGCRGRLLVWPVKNRAGSPPPARYRLAVSDIAHQGVISLSWQLKARPIGVGWAILPPRPASDCR